MNRQRYERVPQRESPPISLSTLQNYNYNSGVPNSISSNSAASSIYTPSILTPSIPSSPPPSFHTHSSPGTPRPSAAQIANNVNGNGVPYAELWGVAPSTVGGETIDTESRLGEEATAIITSLKQRVEWLEESIGRLLMEKETSANSSVTVTNDHPRRDNCCVTFTDASPDMERALAMGGQNCCVKFKTRKEHNKHDQRQQRYMVAIIMLFVCIMTVAIVRVTVNGKHTNIVVSEASTMGTTDE